FSSMFREPQRKQNGFLCKFADDFRPGSFIGVWLLSERDNSIARPPDVPCHAPALPRVLLPLAQASRMLLNQLLMAALLLRQESQLVKPRHHLVPQAAALSDGHPPPSHERGHVVLCPELLFGGFIPELGGVRRSHLAAGVAPRVLPEVSFWL